MRSMFKINWTLPKTPEDGIERALIKYRLYLEEKGFRESTVDINSGNVKRYLKYVKTDHPSAEDYTKFRESLHCWKLSRSTLNQYGYAVRAYHEMIGEQIEFKRITPN